MRKALIFLLILLAASCAATKQASKPASGGYSALDFEAPPVKMEKFQPGEDSRHASLWDDNRSGSILFSDLKARRVNDVVTINIVEQASSKGDATTKLQKSSTLGAGLDSFFGLENRAARSNPDMNMSSLLGARTKNDFDGKGETERTGKLIATMSAIVTEVLPNGNLRIEGRRLVKINNEEQVMILSGIVRPRDVATDNTILSSQIADARIIYSGVGDVSDKQRPGWFNRGVDKAWPF